jgi:hypothetical protein
MMSTVPGILLRAFSSRPTISILGNSISCAFTKIEKELPHNNTIDESQASLLRGKKIS